MSNWFAEASHSWTWLQWMREVVAEDMAPASTLPMLIDGMAKWDADVAGDRHGTGDPDRINPGDGFVYAAGMLSRAGKDVLARALRHAITWGIDDPMNWHGLPPEARDHWAAVDHVVKVVLDGWLTLWTDLAMFQDQPDVGLDQWRGLADQAGQIIDGLGRAAWAQTR